MGPVDARRVGGLDRSGGLAVQGDRLGVQAVQAVQTGHLGVEVQRQSVPFALLDQVPDEFPLPVHGDRLAAQRREVDPDPPGFGVPTELQMDAVVQQPLRTHPSGDPEVDQQVGDRLLDDAGPHPVQHVLAGAALQHHRVDALQLQHAGQQQSGRPGADDRDVGAQRAHRRPPFGEDGSSNSCGENHSTK